MDHFSIAYGLFCDTQQENLEYIYRGDFDISITDNLLALAEESLRIANHKNVIKKRVYYVMVEGLQNITRHQQEKIGNVNIEPGLFVLQRRKNSYFITTGNIVEKQYIQGLKKQLDKLKRFDEQELSSYYINNLKESSFSNKGGAGLGLIEMARKSKGFLSYSFKRVKGKYYYFYLLTEIQLDKNNPENNVSEVEFSLDNIKSLHTLLKKESIALNYSGIFNQNNLVNLLNIIENQLRDTLIVKMKMFSIVVEMLQNLVKHAANYEINNITGKYGIFFISEQVNSFTLTSGNYVSNEEAIELVKRVDSINKLNNTELNNLYNIHLLNYDKKENTGAKVGLIDMRLKSQNLLSCSIKKVNKNFSFFTFQVKLSTIKLQKPELHIEGTYDKPEVTIDPNNNKFIIQGKSIPEHAESFYEPIFTWFDNYIKNPNILTIFEFKLEYVNTHSAQQIVKIFYKIKELTKSHKTEIRWFYKQENNDILELGQRLELISDVDLSYIEMLA